MIHCLHNLADVLEKHGAEIPPTLRDSELKKEAINLENNYLERYSKVVCMIYINLYPLLVSLERKNGDTMYLIINCFYNSFLNYI